MSAWWGEYTRKFTTSNHLVVVVVVVVSSNLIHLRAWLLRSMLPVAQHLCIDVQALQDEGVKPSGSTARKSSPAASAAASK